MRYTPDQRGVAKLLVGADMRRAMRQVAEAGKQYAVLIAPYSEGDYARSFKTAVDVQRKRATGTVYNTAGHAMAVEWGTEHVEGQHVLGRTIDFLEANLR